MRSWTFLTIGTWITAIGVSLVQKSKSKTSHCSLVVYLRVGLDLFESARMNSLAMHHSGRVNTSAFEPARVNSLQNLTLVELALSFLNRLGWTVQNFSTLLEWALSSSSQLGWICPTNFDSSRVNSSSLSWLEWTIPESVLWSSWLTFLWVDSVHYLCWNSFACHCGVGSSLLRVSSSVNF